MIDGVVVTPLRQIVDDRGKVMHMLRADASEFPGFGELYFSVVNHGAVKAWKKHTVMTMVLAVPVGRVRIVLYDDRPGSATAGKVQEIITGPDEYMRIVVPPGLWSGFEGLAREPSMLVNCASIVHTPDEALRLEAQDPTIPYSWRQAGDE